MLRLLADEPLQLPKHSHIKASAVRRNLRKLRSTDGLAKAIDSLANSQAPTMAPRARPADSGSEPVHAGGWDGQAKVDVPVHDGQTGQDVTVTVDASKGDSAATVKHEHKVLVADCPDASGAVPGTMHFGESYRLTAPLADGDSVVVNISLDAKSAIEGHTSNDGTLHDWDQKMDFLAHAGAEIVDSHGKTIYSVIPPMVWTAHAEANLTDPDALTGDSFDIQGPGFHHFLGTTFRDTLGTAGQLSEAMLKALGADWVIGAREARDAFSEDKRTHWDTGDCLKVALSAPKTQLGGGESVVAAAQLSTPKGGVAPAKLTADVDNPEAVVSPTSTDADATPTHLTVIAPSRFDDGSSFQLRVNAVSKQGRGSASLVFNAAPNGYELRLTSLYDEQYTNATFYCYPFSCYIDGSGSKHFANSASIPLARAAAPGSPWTGGGTLSWDAFTYNDDGVSDTCGDGSQYTIDFDGLSSSGGQLAIDSLYVSPEGADPGVTLTLHTSTPPAFGERITNHGCGNKVTDITGQWDPLSLLKRSGAPGVEQVGTGPNPTYRVTGWQPGTDPGVYARRDFSFSGDNGYGEPQSGQLRLEIIQAPGTGGP